MRQASLVEQVEIVEYSNLNSVIENEEVPENTEEYVTNAIEDLQENRIEDNEETNEYIECEDNAEELITKGIK